MALLNISHPTVLTLTLPSLTILALDSQLTEQLFDRVVSHSYDKLIQLRPCVFLACFGACHLIDQIRDALLADPPQNPRFVGDLAVFVQNTINSVLGNARDADADADADGVRGRVGDGENTVEFVLIGRCDLDSRCYVFNISKGTNNNTWMCFAKRQVERVATATTRPIRAMTKFLAENVVDENIDEVEAIKYAWKCIRYATMFNWRSGGKIQIVVVKPGSSVVHAWEQDDPNNCNNEYIYRGERRSEGY